MKPEEAEYVKRRLMRAEETLEDAEMLTNGGRLNGAVNRLYYACFHAVSALLYTEGYTSSKHSGVRSLFDLHWMKDARLPAELGMFYRVLFKSRQESDYGDFARFELAAIEEWLKEAKKFVEVVSAKAREGL
ncbi:MAG: HEPN domain-containing protein [Armatimonadetes bacterium]|nr:HEPN domain-containing protein [Armatimonadota bacterium]